MAFEVKRINPLDRQPRKAVGISLPFSGQAVFNSTYTTKDAIKNMYKKLVDIVKRIYKNIVLKFLEKARELIKKGLNALIEFLGLEITSAEVKFK